MTAITIAISGNEQLENLLHRTNIPTKVKHDYSAVRDFYGLILDAHITAAAMEHLGMCSVEEIPTQNGFPGSLDSASVDAKQKYLSEIVQALITRFMFHYTQPLSAEIDTTEAEERKDDSCPSTAAEKGKHDDYVFNYALSVIGLGLLARNFEDASHEGDGDRLMRCWKMFMLHFKADHRTKYAVEAFNLLAHVYAVLAPRKSHQLVWNRTCNKRGGPGNNIPLDLQNEHLNREFKDDINTFRANITPKSIARSSQAIAPLSELLQKMDHHLSVKRPSGRHVGPGVKQGFEVVLKVLILEQVFQHKSGRQHCAFPNLGMNPLEGINSNINGLRKWMVSWRKAIHVDMQLTKQVY